MDQNTSLSLSNSGVLSIIEQEKLLNEAKELVVSGERENAYALVIQVLQNNKNNPDAIWMYVNLTPNQDKVLPALRRLLVLQPDHQKAQALLRKLEHSTLEPDFQVTTPTPSKQVNEVGVSQPNSDKQFQLMQEMVLQQQRMLEYQLKQANNQPAINITNVNNSSASANAVAVAGLPLDSGRNERAYSIGKFFATFFCTFGVAHLLNGKPIMGITTMLLGWVWAMIFIPSIFVLIGLLLIPVHLKFARSNAEAGARYD